MQGQLEQIDGRWQLRFTRKRAHRPEKVWRVNKFDDLGKAARDAAGWDVCLDVLVYHLNDEEAPWTPAERWQDVHAAYVERFGPEAQPLARRRRLPHREPQSSIAW